MVYIHDIASFNGNIDDGSSETLSVETDDMHVTDVLTILDNGTQDNKPSQYTMTQRVRIDTLRQNTPPFMFYGEKTNVTHRSYVDPAIPPKFQSEFENTSGGGDTYRIIMMSLGWP